MSEDTVTGIICTGYQRVCSPSKGMPDDLFLMFMDSGYGPYWTAGELVAVPFSYQRWHLLTQEEYTAAVAARLKGLIPPEVLSKFLVEKVARVAKD